MAAKSPDRRREHHGREDETRDVAAPVEREHDREQLDKQKADGPWSKQLSQAHQAEQHRQQRKPPHIQPAGPVSPQVDECNRRSNQPAERPGKRLPALGRKRFALAENLALDVWQEYVHAVVCVQDGGWRGGSFRSA